MSNLLGLAAPTTRIMTSSNSDEYNTPRWLWEPGLSVWSRAEYDIDVATNSSATVPAKICYTKDNNSLAKGWHHALVGGHQFTTLWMNPPFSRNKEFVAKLINEYRKGNLEAICLNKLDTRTEWGKMLFDNASAMCLVRGYVQFDGAKQTATFTTALWYFGGFPERFMQAYKSVGYCFPAAVFQDFDRVQQLKFVEV